MSRTTLRWTLAAALAAGLAIAARAADDEAKPLVRGTDPAQFRLVGIGPETITISEDGEVHLTGRPNGYFATKDEYEDYVLSFEWKYDRPEGLDSDEGFEGNSGLLVHIQGEHKVWPRCTEVQLAYGDAGHIFAINGAKFTDDLDREALKKSRKPVGEWNREEVTCKDGRITCTLNGVEVDRGTGAEPDRGSIGWQSEGAPIRFRKLTIRTLD